jgi:hypothetical protein
MRLSAPLLLLPLLALPAGCASGVPADPPGITESALPPIPYCRDEMVAYVELTRLARSHGDGWTVFAPAIDALQQRVVDCVDDAAERFHLLDLTPTPVPPANCTADCGPLRSAARRLVPSAG